MSSMHFNDLFGENAFTIILFGYFTLLAIGFLMMAGRSNTSDAQDTSSEQKAGTRRSRILTTIYLLLLFFTGVFAIFGSLMSWLPDGVHFVIGVIFALLFLVFPYWCAFGDLIHRR